MNIYNTDDMPQKKTYNKYSIVNVPASEITNKGQDEEKTECGLLNKKVQFYAYMPP